MAFGFLGSLANIPLLSQVRRGPSGPSIPTWDPSPVPLGAFNPHVGSIPLGTHQGEQSVAGIHSHRWDGTGNVTVVSPELHEWILLLILVCPCHSSCRRWGTVAPWCDLTGSGPSGCDGTG